MRWWEYLMFWRWIGTWWSHHQEKVAQEAAVEDKFKALLREGEERRGDLQTAVQELRKTREQRQAESLRKTRVRLPSHPEPTRSNP